MDKLNDKLEELGSKATFSNHGETRRGGYRKILWHHGTYSGGIEIGELPEQRIIYASIKGTEEERLTGSFVEWLIRHFCKKISTIEVFPENARTGWE